MDQLMVMKYLRFNFCHPVKVHTTLTRLLTTPPECHSIIIDSKGSNLIEIPITRYSAGKWKITLDWEYENQTFTHTKQFEVKKRWVAV